MHSTQHPAPSITHPQSSCEPLYRKFGRNWINGAGLAEPAAGPKLQDNTGTLFYPGGSRPQALIRTSPLANAVPDSVGKDAVLIGLMEALARS